MANSVPETISSTDGVVLRVYHLGGSGPPLLMSHATGFCGQVWQPMADTMADTYSCYAWDFRAHGRSTRPIDKELVWSGYAADVLAIAAVISPDEPVAAIGHSMGGTALALAEVAKPGTLSKAWTFEPILFGADHLGEDSEPSQIATGARRRRAVFDSRDEVYERYSSRPPLSMLDPRALQAYVDHGFEDLEDGTVRLRCRPEDEADTFENHNSGASTIVGQLTIPFAAAASGDNLPPAIAVKAAAATFSNVELLTYNELSHFGPLQDPDGMAKDVLKWLA
ncbi:MAG: alpha/beta fold hydrolase [Acidimicrobiales bacterium]